jgi:fructokinase
MFKITAIGEILFDMYPTSKNLGGAPLNFLYHVHKITGCGNMVSRVGHDVLGKKVFDFLYKNKISTRFIQEDHLHPTGVATVLMNENKQPSFVIDADRAYDFIETSEELEQLVKKETDCFYFGTLAQRNEVTRKTIQLLFNKGTEYFYDLNIRDDFFNKEIIELSLRAADVLKVSIEELKLLNDLFLPAPLGNETFDIEKTSAELMEKFNIELLAVTLGSDGSALFSSSEFIRKDGTNGSDGTSGLTEETERRTGKFDYYKPNPVEPVDTLGAGDAFASILCIGYLQRWSLRKINKLANNFAAEICRIKGALPEDEGVYSYIKEKIKND